jgi:hypothetical protein
MELSEADKLHILEALKKPSTMALVLLEKHAGNPAALDLARDLETSGKCRWPVLQQLRVWQADAR